MPLFPANFVEDLKSHVDIVQVVQERVPLRKSGVTWKGLCPFHGEKTPSFHVNGEKGFFHCFGCGVGGDVIKFVELHDKVTFPEAVRQLAARAGLTVPEGGGFAAGRRIVARARGAAQGPRGGRRLVPRATRLAGRPGGAAPGRRSRHDRRDRRGARDGVRPGLGRAPAASNERRVRRAAAAEERAAGPAGRGAAPGSVQESPDDPDLPRQRVDHRVRRPRHAGRPAAEISQLPRNGYLRQGTNAVWIAPREAVDQPAEVRRPGRGLFRLGAGLAGGHHQRGGLVGHGADAGAGAAAAPVRRQGRPQLRPRRGGTGGGGALVGTAGHGRVSGERRHAAGGRRSR